MADDFLQIMKVLPDPNAFMQGQQQAAQLQGQQLQNQTSQFDLQQAQQNAVAQQQANQAYNQDLAQFIQNPTAEGASTMALKHPAQAKQISDAWSMRDKAVQDADRQQLANVYSLIDNNRADLAQQQLETRLAADQQSGRNEPMVQTLLDTLKANPDHAKGVAAYLLASIPGGDDFAKTLKVIGDGKPGTHVINPGGALVDDSGKELYRSSAAPHYATLKNADGTQSLVEVPGGGGAGTPGATFKGGWTPRGANPDASVNNKISMAAQMLGVGPTDDLSGASPMAVAKAMTANENVDPKYNNPAAIMDPATGKLKQFPSQQAGLNAAAALVARKLKNGQTTVQTLVEGLPSGGSQPGGARVVATSQGGGDQSVAPGDTTKTGDEYLATVPSDLANRAKALLEGRTPYPSQAALRSPEVQKVLAVAQQADHSFDATTWFRRKKTAADYSPGGAIGQTLTSGKTVINHLYEMAKESEALGGVSWTPMNWATNAARRSMSNTDLAKYDQARTLVAPELAKFLTGKAPAQGEIEKHYAAFDPNQGPDARKARIAESIDLIAGRFGPLVQGYKDAMGSTFDIDHAVPGGSVTDKLNALKRWANGGSLSAPQAAPPRLQTRDQVQALPPGSKFIWVDGQVHTRK